MEIKASEIRLNNWVDYNGTYIQIKGIDFDEYRSDPAEYYANNRTLNAYKPICLLPEILLKAGFEQNEYLVFTKDYMTVALYSDGYAFFDGHYKIGVGFRHVHTFQNVFFALTSTELKIEL